MMVLCLSRLGFSQSPDSGSIRGQILDQNGAAIVGAEVSALNQQTVIYRETKTDKGGLWHSCFSLVLDLDFSGTRNSLDRDVYRRSR